MSLKYRIGQIGWHNFENLAQTLLKAIVAPGVSSFGGSKDGGRDASYSGAAEFPSPADRWEGRWVFQVKYFDLDDQGADTARKRLNSTFKREIASIAVRNARKIDNYVLITNIPLTAGSRDELPKTAREGGFAGNFCTIDGIEICQWMDMHPQIRRSYPQLLGLADLDIILNREVYNRARAYFEQWSPRLSVFVRTDAYTHALQKLAAHRFIVLDGPPEAGKSTIAAAVAFLLASEGMRYLMFGDQIKSLKFSMLPRNKYLSLTTPSGRWT